MRDISNMVHFSYTRQKDPLGLGHAVLTARELVGDEPFAVLLGDVIIPGPGQQPAQLIEIYEATGIGAIAVEAVPQEKTYLYGVIDGEPAQQTKWGEQSVAGARPGGEAQPRGSAVEPGGDGPLRSAA